MKTKSYCLFDSIFQYCLVLHAEDASALCFFKKIWFHIDDLIYFWANVLLSSCLTALFGILFSIIGCRYIQILMKCCYFNCQLCNTILHGLLVQGGAAVWCIGFQKIQGQGITILGGTVHGKIKVLSANKANFYI